MEQLSHERAGNIALTFTQSPMGSQRMQNNNAKMPPMFGAEIMRESRLEPSLLGSIIPSLDPDPPGPSHSSAFMGDDTSPPAEVAGAKRDRFPVAPALTDSPRSPVSGKDGPREWAEDVATTAVAAAGEGTRGGGARARAGAGLARGTVLGQQEAEMARRRKSRVKHGLRVLLRGTSRCGKSTILWDYCHRAAMSGYRVVLVYLKKHESEELTSLPRSMRAGRTPGGGDELRGWEAPALGRIGIKYVRSRDDLAWYLASLHTLKRKQWPTVIAVDDLDKIIETSAGSGSGGSGGGIGAAASRILALLQDTAEFFDKSRAGALSTRAAAAAASNSTGGKPPTATTGATLTPQQATERAGGDGGAGGTAMSQPLPSGNLALGGGGFAGTPGEAGRQAGGRLAGGGQEEAAVRVVGTCSMSDRGMLSLYGRFVHAVAKVQNTTGPDCFSLRLDHGIGTAPHPHPCPLPRPTVPRGPSDGSGGLAPGFTPLDGGSGSGSRGDGGGVAQVDVVDFVRSQLDGSFAVF